MKKKHAYKTTSFNTPTYHWGQALVIGYAF